MNILDKLVLGKREFDDDNEVRQLYRLIDWRWRKANFAILWATFYIFFSN